MIKAIIFDMDGVIIDSHSVAYQLLCETANTFGCNLTIEKIKIWGSLSSRQFWTRVKEQYNLPHDISLLITSYNQDREIELYKFMEPVPGVKEFLHDIKRNQVKIALATSATKKRMDAVIDLFGLRTLFDVIVCDEEVVASKPDPQIFLLASQKLAVEPVECLVIEDSENGKIAAKKAGMKCLGFKGLSHVNENMEGSDMLFFSFNELNIKELQKQI
ncbi:HAD-IA family hydrolase [Paenibacillus sp. LMG 31456]|uniref:HAD-IA family hydrolase n=1 Tax=Paenibacillus foliorum TaxID=2654974 RepID=A0A972GPA4_9BACL|nr:HAD family phosphatase [Paenibacillus foliorum]NOU94406.1 HAD-IA family hydrolase [Paenibacillus foliorum]